MPRYLLLAALFGTATLAAESPSDAAGFAWVSFPDPQLQLCGLPWFAENAPELWRLPKAARQRVPNGVWNRAVAPDGGRIRFRSATTRLALRVEVRQAARRGTFFDAFVDNAFAGSASVTGARTAELTLFNGRDRSAKNITVYLPHTAEVRVLGVGVDAGSKLEPPDAFALAAPLVCYGSSVLQGTGADHPAQTYPAILARRLNVDFINLGFGGAGKAEPEVVALVSQLDACGYLFDLGKSYGNQTHEPFVAMLARIRMQHPVTPIVVVTPIYSTNEASDAAYLEKSVRLREMMRNAALARSTSGDRTVFVAEGIELFGPEDRTLFRDPQHPNDEGNERIAARLAPLMQRLLPRP